MRYITEYQPAISETCETFIFFNIVPAFQNDSSSVYSLDYVIETLEDEISQNNQQEIFGIKLEDIKILKQLSAENVDYIEF